MPSKTQIAGTLSEQIMSILSAKPMAVRSLQRRLKRNGEEPTLAAVFRALYKLRNQGLIADDGVISVAAGDASLVHVEAMLEALREGKPRPTERGHLGHYHLTKAGTVAATFYRVMQKNTSPKRLGTTKRARESFYQTLLELVMIPGR